MKRRKQTFSFIRFISSMKFGMILLILLAGYSTFGTLIPQGNMLSFYEDGYSDGVFTLIQFFQLHNVYSSIYFIILTLLLSANLIFCSIRRLPSAISLYRNDLNAENIAGKKHDFEIPLDTAEDPHTLFPRLGFKQVNTEEIDGRKIFSGVRRRSGHFGSYFVHLGLLLVIIAFSMGKVFGFETYIRGIPGDELIITDTDLTLSISDFDIFYRADNSVHQYVSTVELKGAQDEVLETGEISVNDPLRSNGYKLYQSGTGWMLQLVVRENGNEILRDRFYQSGIVFLEENNLALEFRNFYPDFVLSDGRAYTRTPFLNRPRYLFILYENGESVHMNVAAPGETVRFGDIEFQAFEPRLFTVLQVVRDPWTIFAALGSILMILGLFLTFYYVPQYLAAEETDNYLLLSGSSPKNREAYKLFIEDRLAIIRKGEGK